MRSHRTCLHRFVSLLLFTMLVASLAAGAAPDTTLGNFLAAVRQQGVLSRDWTPETAAREALKERALHPELAEQDLAAFDAFAKQMRSNN